MIGAEFYLHGFFEKVVFAVGEALFVAAFIAGTLEPYLRQRFLDDFARNVAATLAGEELPEAVREHIRNQFEPDRLIRFNYHKHYKLESVGDGKVSVTTTTEYETANYSRKPQRYTPHLADEESYAPEFLSLSVDEECFQGEELRMRVTRKQPEIPEGHGSKRVDGPVRTIAGKRFGEPPDRVRVRWELRETRNERDFDLSAFAGGTLNVKITADVPEGLVFWADPAREGFKCSSAVNVWRYEGFFTRGSQVIVRWWPADEMDVSQ